MSEPILKAMWERGIIVSFAEGRRLIEQGAVRIGDARIISEDVHIDPGVTIQVGKKDFKPNKNQ